ncbi:MAG TPA: LOG family protein [Candidatus Caenarcaniphilales bacterium]
MDSPPPTDALQLLQAELVQLVEQLPTLRHGKLIYQALATLVRMSDDAIDRLDWKILKSSLQDLEKGFQTFASYRHTRKITIFGSSRMQADAPEYLLAVEFARRVTQQGFMVMTGGGGGIMEAGNKGAGLGNSFGLNIELPFEQGANPFIEGTDKLINFKYFFTRKLFFLRETDAIALFPGGYGTLDEAFECLTLSQTGKSPPIPVVLIDRPGGTYWKDWDAYIQKHLIQSGMISPEDNRLYVITDNLDVACQAISDFYRVYHSSRYVGERLVLRLKKELADADVEQLNQAYQDIVLAGQIEKSQALPEEFQGTQAVPEDLQGETAGLSRLVFQFNQRDHGRLYHLIAEINRMGTSAPEADHPELK